MRRFLSIVVAALLLVACAERGRPVVPPAVRGSACTPAGVSLAIAPDVGEWVCTTTMRRQVLPDGRTVRAADGVVDNCGRASFRGVIKNCTNEALVMRRVRQDVDGELGPSAEYADLFVAANGQVAFDVETRGIGELTVAADLESAGAGGRTLTVNAHARVRQVSVTISE